MTFLKPRGVRRAGRRWSSALIVLLGRVCSATDVCLKPHPGTQLTAAVLAVSGICLALSSFNQKVDLAGFQHVLEDRRVHPNESAMLAPVLEHLGEGGGRGRACSFRVVQSGHHFWFGKTEEAAEEI